MGRTKCAPHKRDPCRSAESGSSQSRNQDQLSPVGSGLLRRTLALLVNLVSFGWTSSASRSQAPQWPWRDASPALRSSPEVNMDSSLSKRNGHVLLSDSPKQSRRSFLCGRRNGVKRAANIPSASRAASADCECALLTPDSHHSISDVTPVESGAEGGAGGVWSFTPWRSGGYSEFRADFGAKCARFVDSYIYRSAAEVTSPADVTENNNQKCSNCKCKSRIGFLKT